MTGNNAFIEQLSKALLGLMNGGSIGFDLVSKLANHSNVLTIQGTNGRIESSGAIGNDVVWVPTGIKRDGSIEQVPTTAGMRSDPMITLGHELAHVEYNWGGETSTNWFNIQTVKGDRDIPTSEIHTTHRENQLRSENGLPLRTYYGVDQYGTGIVPGIIRPSVGASRYYNSRGVTNYHPLRRGVAPYIY